MVDPPVVSPSPETSVITALKTAFGTIPLCSWKYSSSVEIKPLMMNGERINQELLYSLEK